MKHAREKADLSVDDVVFRARIPRSVVEALEAEDFAVFTSPTYAKSFLRQYSDFLEVDADRWLNALEPAAYVTGEGIPVYVGGEPAQAPKRSSSESRHPKVESDPVSGNRWSAVWVMFLTAGLVISITKGYQTFEKKFGGESVPVKTEGREETKPGQTAIGDPSPSPNPTETQPAPAVNPQPENPQPPLPPPRAVIIRE
ncbi:MAG TPA: helix-turn-helix domain-containing protein [Luteolibacter sp.]|nr:helix-turn-helix domain-containing protein [Luteolibacter sp.]